MTVGARLQHGHDRSPAGSTGKVGCPVRPGVGRVSVLAATSAGGRRTTGRLGEARPAACPFVVAPGGGPRIGWFLDSRNRIPPRQDLPREDPGPLSRGPSGPSKDRHANKENTNSNKENTTHIDCVRPMCVQSPFRPSRDSMATIVHLLPPCTRGTRRDRAAADRPAQRDRIRRVCSVVDQGTRLASSRGRGSTRIATDPDGFR